MDKKRNEAIINVFLKNIKVDTFIAGKKEPKNPKKTELKQVLVKQVTYSVELFCFDINIFDDMYYRLNYRKLMKDFIDVDFWETFDVRTHKEPSDYDKWVRYNDIKCNIEQQLKIEIEILNHIK